MNKNQKEKTIPTLDIKSLRRDLFIYDEITEMEAIRF